MDAMRSMRSLEGCTAEMQPGRRPSRLARAAAHRGSHLRVTVIDSCSRQHQHSIFNRRHAFASSRRISPELCLNASPPMKEGAGKAGAGWLPLSAMRDAGCVRFVHSG